MAGGSWRKWTHAVTLANYSETYALLKRTAVSNGETPEKQQMKRYKAQS
jgi:hypothetical protein